MGVGEGLSGPREGFGGRQNQKLRTVSVGKWIQGSKGLIAFGCG